MNGYWAMGNIACKYPFHLDMGMMATLIYCLCLSELIMKTLLLIVLVRGFRSIFILPAREKCVTFSDLQYRLVQGSTFQIIIITTLTK